MLAVSPSAKSTLTLPPRIYNTMMPQKHARPLFRRPGIDMLGDRVFFRAIAPGPNSSIRWIAGASAWSGQIGPDPSGPTADQKFPVAVRAGRPVAARIVRRTGHL